MFKNFLKQVNDKISTNDDSVEVDIHVNDPNAKNSSSVSSNENFNLSSDESVNNSYKSKTIKTNEISNRKNNISDDEFQNSKNNNFLTSLAKLNDSKIENDRTIESSEINNNFSNNTENHDKLIQIELEKLNNSLLKQIDLLTV